MHRGVLKSEIFGMYRLRLLCNRCVCSLLQQRTAFTDSNTKDGNVPVITVPAYIQNKLSKLKRIRDLENLENTRKRSRQGNKNVLLISCKRRAFNHYLGQTHKKFEPVRLASQGWMRSKYAGDYFIINSYGKNPSIDPDCVRAQNFSELHLHPYVLEGLQHLGFTKPTAIQEQAIPVILKQNNTLCCAETGSGKTLAYLAPLIHLLRKNKDELIRERPPNSPQGLILVPGRELAEQIGEIASALSVNCGISVNVLLGGQSPEEFANMKKKHYGLDLIISTMGVMKRFVSRNTYNLQFVQHVVIDEADTMVDDSFCEPLRQLLNRVHFQEGPPTPGSNITEGAQLILSGATMPLYLNEVFEKIVNVDTLVQIRTSHLHRIMPHVTQKFMKVKKDVKIGILLELVTEDLKNKKGVIIFCNSANGCHFVHKFLEENGVKNLCLHGDMPSESRQGQFASFQRGDLDVLCCTDLGSRGLDTTRAQHIINFEFPNHISDYIHRAGRTGRVGMRGGLVTNLISRRFEVILVQKIEAAARKIGVLPNVNANIQRNINDYITRKENKTAMTTL